MRKRRPTVLTIAGFDPSAGAGLLADIKTFEQHKVYGMAVQTANTIQTDKEFLTCGWIDEDLALKQLDTLLEEYTFSCVKIGMVPSIDFVEKVLNHFQEKKTKIIWDTVLSATAGEEPFLKGLKDSKLQDVLSRVYMITPNAEEVTEIAGLSNKEEAARYLSRFTNVYLKGGHIPENLGKDYLYTTKGKIYPFRNQAKKAFKKHGSGCVLSSALTANLALGFPLIKACLKSKNYITRVLESNSELLGYHKR